jgi:hypothetical protein
MSMWMGWRAGLVAAALPGGTLDPGDSGLAFDASGVAWYAEHTAGRVSVRRLP